LKSSSTTLTVLELEELDSVLAWMDAIRPQVRSYYPRQIRVAPALFSSGKIFVDDLVEKAEEIMALYPASSPSTGASSSSSSSSPTATTWLGSAASAAALQVQDAIIASLGCGRFMPPCRASVIRSIRFASRPVLRCPDADCPNPLSCQGNVLAITPAGRVNLIAVHHKNEGRRNTESSSPIDLLLPEGPLTIMLTWWTSTGWDMAFSSACAAGEDRDAYLTVFMRPMGAMRKRVNPFSCAELSTYWRALVNNSAPASFKDAPHTLTDLRSTFIEWFTATVEDESLWGPYASCMGNKPSSWKQVGFMILLYP
jgi:hypothetical protein